MYIYRVSFYRFNFATPTLGQQERITGAGFIVFIHFIKTVFLYLIDSHAK